MRCYFCKWFMLDIISDKYETGKPFCGLHGRAQVNPEGEQINLNHYGSCWYLPKKGEVQLRLEFKDYE